MWWCLQLAQHIESRTREQAARLSLLVHVDQLGICHAPVSTHLSFEHPSYCDCLSPLTGWLTAGSVGWVGAVGGDGSRVPAGVWARASQRAHPCRGVSDAGRQAAEAGREGGDGLSLGGGGGVSGMASFTRSRWRTWHPRRPSSSTDRTHAPRLQWNATEQGSRQ